MSHQQYLLFIFLSRRQQFVPVHHPFSLFSLINTSAVCSGLTSHQQSVPVSYPFSLFSLFIAAAICTGSTSNQQSLPVHQIVSLFSLINTSAQHYFFGLVAVLQIGHCSTNIPVWINLQGAGLPEEYQQVEARACASTSQDAVSACCQEETPAVVRNCSTFLIYYLHSPGGCYRAYCAQPSLSPSI